MTIISMQFPPLDKFLFYSHVSRIFDATILIASPCTHHVRRQPLRRRRRSSAVLVSPRSIICAIARLNDIDGRRRRFRKNEKLKTRRPIASLSARHPSRNWSSPTGSKTTRFLRSGADIQFARPSVRRIVILADFNGASGNFAVEPATRNPNVVATSRNAIRRARLRIARYNGVLIAYAATRLVKIALMEFAKRALKSIRPSRGGGGFGSGSGANDSGKYVS